MSACCVSSSGRVRSHDFHRISHDHMTAVKLKIVKEENNNQSACLEENLDMSVTCSVVIGSLYSIIIFLRRLTQRIVLIFYSYRSFTVISSPIMLNKYYIVICII